MLRLALTALIAACDPQGGEGSNRLAGGAGTFDTGTSQSGPDSDACPGSFEAEPGRGETSFTRHDAGDPLVLRHGPAGGWVLALAFEVANARVDDPVPEAGGASVEVTIRSREDPQVTASDNLPWNHALTSSGRCLGQLWNHRVYLAVAAPTACALQGTEFTLDWTVADAVDPTRRSEGSTSFEARFEEMYGTLPTCGS